MLHTIFNSMALSFLALFPILNPPAMAPVFLQMTSEVDDAQRHAIAGKIGRYTFFLLCTILLLGSWLLKLFGISVHVIRVAGGLLLFHTAWDMLNNKPKESGSEHVAPKRNMLSQAFFPLTLPVTAGPGSMAITLTLVPNGGFFSYGALTEMAGLIMGIAMAALSVFLFYRYSEYLIRKMGDTGAKTISNISAFALLAIGVQIVWDGVRGLLLTIH